MRPQRTNTVRETNSRRALRAAIPGALIAALTPALAFAGGSGVTDAGLSTGFQDTSFGHLKRGRALVAADFNLDGRVDFFVGNPGDESVILINRPASDGSPAFQVSQVLLDGPRAWGAAAADYDNDGDYDLFVSVGGNETIGTDHLYKNLWIESGERNLSFLDVTALAGVAGPVVPAGSLPTPTASANAVWADYDRDGDVDLFVSGNIVSQSLPEFRGRNTLWRNEGDGTFTDVTVQAGLSTIRRKTRHSTFFDADNDGDLDLYENNYTDFNVLWKNRLMETGTAEFAVATSQFAGGPGEDLRFPKKSFASASADFDNDGRQDLIVFFRGENPDPNSPYPIGHALFMNRPGGFVNIAHDSGLNSPFQPVRGVMGCQVGDLDMDGVPDVFIGNGAMLADDSPNGGQTNQLFLSTSAVGSDPRFANHSSLLDFPAAEDPSVTAPYPPYPYRTHGSAIVDVDGDGLPELAVTNGGPASFSDFVREPNRLFRFDWSPVPSTFTVRALGNGRTVSRDAIGTRFSLTVSAGAGPPRTLRQTLSGGSAFSAQNGFEVTFGLGDADTVHRLEIVWPDGASDVVDSGLAPGGRALVRRSPAPSRVPATLTARPGPGSTVTLEWQAPCESGYTDFHLYEGSIGGDFTNHLPETCSTGGQTSRTLVPSPGSRYFLVAPTDGRIEGSQGRRGDGGERTPPPGACVPRGAVMPLEVTTLRLAAGPPARMTWDPQAGRVGPDVVYDVFGGNLTDLRDHGLAASTACVAAGLTEPAWSDPRPSPPAGSGRYYLLRSGRGCETGPSGRLRSALDARACPAP